MSSPLRSPGGYECAGQISDAFSFSEGLPPLSWFGDLETNKSTARHKKISTKRIPVVYLPGPITFPRISF
jgi:hypothetical protein